jgi:UDP-glucuronate decarboxylase
LKHLITGAAGFIGSHLVDKLLAAGDEVIALDNFLTGRSKNIKHHFDDKKFQFLQQDVIDEIDCKPDAIWHLACPASPIHYQADPLRTIETCYKGTLNVLQLAKKTNAKLLIASTSEVYGDPLIHPQSEQYLGNVNPVGPRACYDEGKRIAETLAFNFWAEYQVQVKIARIFNTYGPRMSPDDGRVISNFIVQALSGQRLTIYGDGKTTRSFCFVKDTVEGLMQIMQSNGDLVFNVGNPNEIDLLCLASLIAEKTFTTASFVHLDKPQDDPQRRMPEISKLTQATGWSPTTALSDGLDQTIFYFKNELQIS